jgi:hypothetical protein
MYIEEDTKETSSISLPIDLTISIGISTLAVIVFGLYPRGVVWIAVKAISSFQ